MTAPLYQLLSLRSSYNFSLYATGNLPSGYSNATVAAFLDYDSATQLEDVASMHAQALPRLPVGTTADPRALTYIKLITPTGDVRVIAQEWVSGTPSLVSGVTLNVVISGKSASDIPTLRAVLVSNGFTQLAITTSG